ncbi:MAG TPA: hypothetical protein VN936_03450 [Candidatus Acidoferrum sp.]|nr:hypothetical protein [Candidatus Acidoferrum sp.]
MNRPLQPASAAMALAALTACASPAGVSDAPSAASLSTPTVRTNDYGNIRWNKSSIHIYKSKGPKSAVLTYWAKDGYSTYPISCQNGGSFGAQQGKTSGNPNRYDHVKYSFVAKTGKPDQCTFTAVLNNTGSPPIATLTVYLNS